MQNKKIDNPIHTWRDSSYLPYDIQNYTTILFCRNPYKRIVSGFLDKYSKHGEFRHLWKYDTITFSKFVETLLNNQAGMVDYHHFGPQTSENFNEDILLHSKSMAIYDIENINYKHIESLYNTNIPDELLTFRGGHEKKTKDNTFEGGVVYDLDMELYSNYDVPIQKFYNEEIKKRVDGYYIHDFAFFKKHGFNYEL